MEDDDDFTFPTVAAARATEGQPASCGDDGPVVANHHHLLQLPLLPDDRAPAASPFWPFAGSAAPKTPAAPVSASPPATAEEEDRMDLLWEGAAAATTAGPIARHAEPPPKQQQRGAEVGAEDDKRRAAAVADAERMDKLWESFNEELLLLRQRGRSSSRSAANDPGLDHWYLCDYSPSDDAESEGTSASSPAERRGYGCAPTMLRASSRAGGAGQFCSSPRSRRRRGGSSRGAAAGWALLLRLFRRLFAVDKTSAAAPSRSRGDGIYVP